MKNYSLALLVLHMCFTMPAVAQNLHVTYRSKISYPGQTLANVWGYVAGGHEYALIGASKGLIITDITNPDNPQQITQIPGPNNLWKEIKTYGHYAYVVSEGGQGIQIIDLSLLPSAALDSYFYTGDGAIAGALNKLHALHIDTTKGFLYAYGGPLLSGGAKIFDLKADPYRPKYVGKFDQLSYIHDGYVDNDTLYGGHIYQGLFSVVNMADKSNPQLITTQETPNKFTHNTWLSTDHRTLFTTDERDNSFLAAYDISNLGNIRLLDKIQSNPGSNSMVHNTHVLGNFAVTSWYKDGFTIVDVSHPDNLVQVGNFDVYPGASGGGSDGCWGVYPYFPSGTVIASVIPTIGGSSGELWILTPEYVRACYLEGKITNGLTGAPLLGVQIDVLGTAPLNRASTLSDGTFKMGQEQDGYFVVRASKAGFQPQEFTVSFQRGDVKTLNLQLFPETGLTVDGTVVKASDNTTVPNASVFFSSYGGNWSTMANAAGYFTLPNLPPGVYDITAGAPGYGQTIKYHYKITANRTLTLRLSSNLKSFQGDTPTRSGTAGAWPNPFSETVHVRFDQLEPGASLSITDLTGRVLQTITPAEDTGQVQLGKDWRPGLYFLSLRQNSGIEQVLRLVKN